MAESEKHFGKGERRPVEPPTPTPAQKDKVARGAGQVATKQGKK